ncbi:hypothetical protein EOL96_08985 [Candidatus Saccharibacteria bacterium]|nr:hypothetical protein [Candidatus Saccharibacteria bacterium]
MAAADFLLNTDYPIDKIVYIASGSVPIDGYPHAIAHGLAFEPLVTGYWSTTPDFEICYEFGSGKFPSTVPTYFYSHSVTMSQDTTTTIDLYTQWIDGPSLTCYYRLFGFEPSNINLDIASPVALSDEFVVSTDYRMMQLVTTGLVNPGTAATYTITHNLGSKPRVMAWYKWVGGLVPLIAAGDTAGGQNMLSVTDNTIIFLNRYGLNVTELHYRIYV